MAAPSAAAVPAATNKLLATEGQGFTRIKKDFGLIRVSSQFELWDRLLMRAARKNAVCQYRATTVREWSWTLNRLTLFFSPGPNCVEFVMSPHSAPCGRGSETQYADTEPRPQGAVCVRPNWLKSSPPLMSGWSLYCLVQRPIPAAGANPNQFSNFRKEVRQILGINRHLVPRARKVLPVALGRGHQSRRRMGFFDPRISQNVTSRRPRP